ncbi:hypothetical protein RI367_002985 [Sorochytrium milnesiophthora]
MVLDASGSEPDDSDHSPHNNDNDDDSDDYRDDDDDYDAVPFLRRSNITARRKSATATNARPTEEWMTSAGFAQQQQQKRRSSITVVSPSLSTSSASSLSSHPSTTSSRRSSLDTRLRPYQRGRRASSVELLSTAAASPYSRPPLPQQLHVRERKISSSSAPSTSSTTLNDPDPVIKGRIVRAAQEPSLSPTSSHLRSSRSVISVAATSSSKSSTPAPATKRRRSSLRKLSITSESSNDSLTSPVSRANTLSPGGQHPAADDMDVDLETRSNSPVSSWQYPTLNDLAVASEPEFGTPVGEDLSSLSLTDRLRRDSLASYVAATSLSEQLPPPKSSGTIASPLLAMVNQAQQEQQQQNGPFLTLQHCTNAAASDTAVKPEAADQELADAAASIQGMSRRSSTVSIKREPSDPPYYDPADSPPTPDTAETIPYTLSAYEWTTSSNSVPTVAPAGEGGLAIAAPGVFVVNSPEASALGVYACRVCDQTFTNMWTLQCHAKEHGHVCDICHKSFSRAYNLKAHQKVHTQEKPFMCQFCHRSFARKQDCLRHQRIHTKERPYMCDNCGMAFSRSDGLTRHKCNLTGEFEGDGDHDPDEDDEDAQVVDATHQPTHDY